MSDGTTKEGVLEKIRKLLALSKSPNLNEATIAIEKAHALLREHNLTMADIGDRQKTPLIEETVFTSKRKSPWKLSILLSLARLNYCAVLTNSTTVLFLGRPDNVLATKILVEWVFECIDRLLSNRKGRGTRYVNNYKRGVSIAIAQRVEWILKKDEVESPAEESTALVVVRNEIDEYQKEKKMPSQKIRKTAVTHNRALAAGYVDGQSIPLSKQIEGEGK